MTTVTRAAELNNGVWTSWLPVTSAWTSQAGCNSAAWARFGIVELSGLVPYIYDPAYAQSVANSLTCLPPEATSWWQGGRTFANTVTSYSLGPVVCPSAYGTVSTSVVSGSSTSVICCPSSYKFARSLANNGGIDGICTSPMTSGQVLTYASPTSNGYASATTTLGNTMLMLAVPVEGYNFATPSTTSSSSKSSPTSPTSLTSTTSSSSNSAATSGSETTVLSGPKPTSTEAVGLSSGAKAGIGGGVAAIAVLAIAGLAFFLFFRRRKRRSLATTIPPGEVFGSSGGGGSMVKMMSQSHSQKNGELVEAYADPTPVQQRWEVDGNSRRVELQA